MSRDGSARRLPPLKQRFDVTVTYLRADNPPRLNPPPPRPSPKMGAMILRVEEPTAKFYRYLFDAVGGPHYWVTRRYLPDDQLLALVNDPETRIAVLYTKGWPAGYFEWTGAEGDGLKIRFFGLVPEAQGRGLGPWFFHEGLKMVWAEEPGAVFIETCTLDNPEALRLYQRMGFTPYEQGRGVVEWRG